MIYLHPDNKIFLDILNIHTIYLSTKLSHCCLRLCYNLRLGSGCNLGKGLSKRWDDVQLVKHKDTVEYLRYIYY